MSYNRALEIVELLTDAGCRAVADVRNAQPPCVLVVPPTRRYDLACGYSLDWTLVVLAPGPGNADAWRDLDRQLALVEGVVDATQATSASYVLNAGEQSMPCYLVTFTEASE